MTDFGDSPYAVLEVARGASVQAIEQAYRRLTGLLADGALASYGMLDGADVGQLRHQLDQAYAVLSDADLRAAFDQTGRIPLHPVSPSTKHEGANKAARLPSAPAPAPAFGTAAPDRVPCHRPAVPGRPTLRVPLLAEVDADAQFDGSLLRALRESAEVSIDELSEWTKIGRRYLIAIENDDFALLPAKVYVRGFVGEIARVLGFDAARVTRSYLRRYSDWAASN